MILGTTALIVAFIFIFSITARWLQILTGPTFEFLQESWALADDPVVEETRSAVAVIYIDSAAGTAGGQRRGTGFNIDPGGLVVTNRHLLEDAAVVRISIPNRGTFIAKDWEISPHVDLAVIDIEGEDLPAVPLAGQPPHPGTELLVIGNPLQFARIANKGLLIDHHENPARDLPFLVVEAAIYPGSSGSPLFNQYGEVVGVVFATLRSRDPSEVKGLAVDVRELDLFLQDIPWKKY